MSLEIERKQINKICEENDISYLALFGSYARDEETADSDIDLLVRYSESKSLFDHVRIERGLKEFFGKKVDLVTERSLHPYIKDYVYSDLKVLYEG